MSWVSKNFGMKFRKALSWKWKNIWLLHSQAFAASFAIMSLQRTFALGNRNSRFSKGNVHHNINLHLHLFTKHLHHQIEICIYMKHLHVHICTSVNSICITDRYFHLHFQRVAFAPTLINLKKGFHISILETWHWHMIIAFVDFTNKEEIRRKETVIFPNEKNFSSRFQTLFSWHQDVKPD